MTLRVIMPTSEWPTEERPEIAPFVVRQVDFLRRKGVEVQPFPFRGAKRLDNYRKAWLEFRDVLRGGDFHLVHAQFGQSGLLALPKRLPLVVTFRGSDLEGVVGKRGRYTSKGSLLRLASRLVARAADEVVVVSDRLGSRLRREDFHVIPSGLDLELFRPLDRAAARAELGWVQEDPIILFGGDPAVPRKQVWLAQAAVEELRRSRPKARLVTLGRISHHKVPVLLNAANAVVLTSAHEGSPNVIKEALACNVPVVSTDVGDVGLRLRGIPGCSIVPPLPSDIARGLEMALNIGRIEGRDSVAALDENRLTEQVIDVYETALRRYERAR